VKPIFGRRVTLQAGGLPIRFAAGVMLLLCAPALLAAQDVTTTQNPLAPDAVPPPPVRRPAPQRLTAGLFVYEGLDFVDYTQGRPGLIGDNRLQQNVAFSSFSASLNYSKLGDQKSYTLATGADVRYYSIQSSVIPSNIYGGGSISTKLGRRVNFRGAANVNYSPFYSFGSFLSQPYPVDPVLSSNDPFVSASQVPIPNSDQNIARINTNTAGGSANLSWLLTSRSSIYTGYSIDYVGSALDSYRVLTQGVHGGYSRRMNQYLSLRAGYGFQRSEQGLEAAPYFDRHSLDTGISFGRPISSSRRTTVGFSTGVTMISQGAHDSFALTGNGWLMYQIKRTWTTGVSYSRSVEKVGGLLTPFISDTVSGHLSGLWTRNFGFSASGGASIGESAFVYSNAYDGIYASARFHYNVSRRVPIFAEYVFYKYLFDQNQILAPGFPRAMHRNGIRFGLAYSTPLIGQRL
jgi:hypothetical protein